jgi:2-hydroxy-3-keto-5-methylthiopentenyl-1-phosphate phosphatase
MTGQILLDFDGTVAIEDTTDSLLERFAEPGWRDVEAEWEAQRIGSRECMARQVDLIRASEAEIDCFIEEMRVDRGFVPFVQACAAARLAVTIVSDGLDRVVHGVIARTGINLPIAANKLEHIGGDRWRLGFPFASANCSSASGNCKCAHGALARGPCIVVGDGRSDFCAAGAADFVLAKGRLQVHCEENGIAHAPIADLCEATALIKTWHGALGRAAEDNSRRAEARYG